MEKNDGKLKIKSKISRIILADWSKDFDCLIMIYYLSSIVPTGLIANQQTLIIFSLVTGVGGV